MEKNERKPLLSARAHAVEVLLSSFLAKDFVASLSCSSLTLTSSALLSRLLSSSPSFLAPSIYSHRFDRPLSFFISLLTSLFISHRTLT
jgi:hypothetical protein